MAEVCAICLRGLAGNACSRLACGHAFHAACLAQQLASRRSTDAAHAPVSLAPLCCAVCRRALADAEAYYNTTVAKSLTQEFVQYKALEKWNGELPQITGGGATPFINLERLSANSGKKRDEK